jgi:hypothetical protein
MTADIVLKKYEDANNYHFTEAVRKWIIEAMEEHTVIKTKVVVRGKDVVRSQNSLLEHVYVNDGPVV